MSSLGESDAAGEGGRPRGEGEDVGCGRVDPHFGVLTSMLLARAQIHNARQDETMRQGAELAAATSSRRLVSPSSWIRRRRTDEPTEPTAEEEPEARDGEMEASEGGHGNGNGGGLLARAEFADALLTTLARVTTTPCQVRSFDDAPLLCEFGKACFGQVCVDLGLLTISHSIAEND